MSLPELIIWDWNGTLLNDAPDLHLVLNQLLDARGLSLIDFERYREIYTHPIRKIYEAVGFDLIKEDFEQLAVEWHDRYSVKEPALELHPDTRSTLETISRCGIKQAVLSALPHHLLEQALERHGLNRYFCAVSGLDNLLGATKLENGRALMGALGANPETTVLIGDTSHDIDVALELNVRCLIVCRGCESRRRLMRLTPFVFDDFAGVFDHLGIEAREQAPL